MNLQPHPLTELSLVKDQRNSSPGILKSADQSAHSLPDLVANTLPEPSVIVRGSCLRSVEQRLSNSIRKASAPGIRTWPGIIFLIYL